MPRDPDCVFCKIVGGQIPAAVVLQDENVLAFMDVGPLAEGHLLVVPRSHCGKLSDLEPEQYAALTLHLPALGKALERVTGAEGWNLLQNNGEVAGQSVPHVHFHLIPRRAGDGLGYRWKPGSYRAGRADELATAYREAFKSLRAER